LTDETATADPSTVFPIMNDVPSLTSQFDELFFDEYYGIVPPEQLILVRPYGDDGDDQVLAELRPRWIIMFDPSLDFIRRIEVRVPAL
jgi:DNA excision repair protein ERCC-4